MHMRCTKTITKCKNNKYLIFQSILRIGHWQLEVIDEMVSILHNNEVLIRWAQEANPLIKLCTWKSSCRTANKQI